MPDRMPRASAVRSSPTVRPRGRRGSAHRQDLRRATPQGITRAQGRLLPSSDGAQGRTLAVQLPLESRTALTGAQMLADHLWELAVKCVVVGELAVHEGIQMHPDAHAIGEGRDGGVGWEVLRHLTEHAACSIAVTQDDELNSGPESFGDLP